MKRILYICSNSPFENSYGAQQRTSLLCDALCENGQVDVVCFTADKMPTLISKPYCSIKYFGLIPASRSFKFTTKYRKVSNLIHSYSPYSVYKKNKFASNLISDLLKETDYDYIVVRYVENAFKCGLYYNKQLIVDVDDMPEQSIISYAETIQHSKIKKIQYWFYAKRARHFTDKFLKRIQHSFIPNESNCKWINSSYLPNIPISNTDLETKISFSDFSEIKNRIFFIGLMSHTPNSLGVSYFIENIWDLVLEKVPSAEFLIAGKGVSPKQKIEWENHKGVQVLGFVSDLEVEYNQSKVVVVPIYHGAGTNIKVLEAMAMNKACVISEFAMRGFENELIDEVNILIAKNNQDFASKIIRLLQDMEFNNFIAKNGKDVIEKKYSYTDFKKCVHKIII